ncbi:unnamed protein product [Tilletia laevis]|nr:hypothetical protein CF335_g5437 [Tilletia laevis]CAD6897124.1 unnamed protein product [Tilletia laevis]CAD6951183.1 unnamed protein product [Tilletia caries]CAD7066698.1 unnamed protein product [Tilletia caries]
MATATAADTRAGRRRRRGRRRNAGAGVTMTISRLVVILAIGISSTLTLALAQTSPAAAAAAAAAVTVSSMSRWGAAASQLDGLLLVHGGKATTNAGYTYTSAPDSSDLLILNLSTPFPLSAPPWHSLTTPATASFHTLSPLSRTSFALFGGQDNLSPTPSANDSLYLLDITDTVNPQWTAEVAAHPEWNQPLRRMLHAAPSDPIAQSLYLLGGERADGSGISTQELWTFSPSPSASASFSQVLPPPTTNIIDGAAPLLADGTIVLVGGLTGPASLAPMNSITSYNPRSQTWSTTAVASANGNASYPAPRRAHVAVPLADNRIFVHGGASADLSTPLADAWVLDWSQSPPLWSPIQSLSNTAAAASGSAPDARFAHSAVSYGNNILLAFGWTGNNAAETSLWVWDGTQASMDAGGNTVGGFWIGSSNSEATSGGVGSVPSYTPDPNAQPLSNGLGWSPSSKSPSGGSKGPSGNSPSLTGSGQPSSTNKPRPSSSGPTKSGGSENKDDSTSAGAKAGIILGMLMGLGLAGGAGYYAYRAYQAHTHPSYHRGAGYGKAGLLLGNNSGDGYDDREEDDAFTRKRSGTGPSGNGGMWGTGAAAVGGFLSSSLAGRKRGRDEIGDHEALMLEKGRYHHLANLPSSYPSPTGAVLGSPALTDSSSAARAALANRSRGLAVGERGLPPVGPRGPKTLSRTEHYTAAVEAAELQMMRNLREEEVSETSMGAGGVIPMAGGLAAAANAGVRAGVRDKIARLVGAGRSQAGPDGMEGYHASEAGAAGGAGAALGAAAVAGAAGGRGGGAGGGYGPRRLDILADEDADEEALRRKYPRQYGAARAMVNPFADRRAGRSGVDEEEEEDEANRLLVAEDEDEYLDPPRRGGGGRGGVAGPRGMYAEPEYRIRPSMEDEADGYVVSPFEDDAAVVSNARPFRGAALATGAQRDSVESSHSADAVRRSQILQHSHQQQPALFSNIINMPPSTSAGMNVAWVDGGVGGGAGPAGDHAAPGGGGGAEMMGAGPDRDDGARSPFIRRSGTWWDRFMATSFLDRSSSGAIKAPTAVDPIRDPRRFNESIASLGTLAESVDGARQGEGDVSVQTAYYNPFGDEYGAGVEQQQQQQRSSRPKLGRLNSALEGGGNPFVAATAAVAASGTDTPSTSTHTDSMYAHTTTSATTVLTSAASSSATTHSSQHGYPSMVAPPAPAVVTSKSTRVRTRSNSPTRKMSTSSRTHASRTTNAQKLGRSLHKPASLSSLSTTGNGSIFTSNGSEGGGAGAGAGAGVSGDRVLRGPSGRVRRTIAMLGGANAHLFVANPDREGSMRSSEGGA